VGATRSSDATASVPDRGRIVRPTSNSASGIVGERVGGPPADEREHFYVCQEWGQAVDKRDLGQVLHHERSGHERLADN
jgi:hypothetical protein